MDTVNVPLTPTESTPLLKRLAKRTAIASLAVVGVGFAYLKFAEKHNVNVNVETTDETNR